MTKMTAVTLGAVESFLDKEKITNKIVVCLSECSFAVCKNYARDG